MGVSLRKHALQDKTISEKFRLLWPYYLWQTSLAAVVILAITLIVDQERTVVIASMGSTAFVCFALPKSYSAQTRNVIGGYLVGLLSGALLSLTPWPYLVEFPLAMGLAFFVMVALDVEHAPAAGTALAVTIHQVNLLVACAIVVAVLVITQVRYLLRKHLKDLL